MIIILTEMPVMLPGSRFAGEFLQEKRWNAAKRNSPSISYMFSRLMRWIAVNYFFYRIHRNQRISYKNSHKNLDPGAEKTQMLLHSTSLMGVICLRLTNS